MNDPKLSYADPPEVVSGQSHDEGSPASVIDRLIDTQTRQNRTSEVGQGIDLVAFLTALPLAVVFYLGMIPFRSTYAGELLNGRIPPIIIYLSFVAMIALLLKYIGYRRQSRVLKRDLLPVEIGRIISTRNAGQFNEFLSKIGTSKRNLLVGRLKKGLAFLLAGRSGKEVSEFLEQQSQIDAQKVAASYSYISLIVWALPILGFIGTVLGIGSAVSEFSGAVNAAEDMAVVKNSLTGVTSGLGVSFNTTLLALVMSMIVMFPMKFIQKRDESLLNEIDSYIQNNFCRRLETEHNVPAPSTSNASLREALDVLQSMFTKSIEKIETNVTREVTKAIESASNNTSALGKALTKEIQSVFSIPNGSYEQFCQEIQELEEHRVRAITRLADQNSLTLKQIDESYQAVLPAFEENSRVIHDLVVNQQQCVRELQPQLGKISHLVEDFSVAVEHACKRNKQINSVDLSDRSQKVLEFIYRSARRSEEIQKVQYHELNRLANAGILPQIKASTSMLIGKLKNSFADSTSCQPQMEVANVQSQKV